MAAQASPSPKASQIPQKQKLTDAPTNLKEAIDWVLRVTGKDGKKNAGNNKCLCLLAKAIKDLLYDAGIESSYRTSISWDIILLEQEKSILQPILSDLGLDNTNPSGCGGTEVIKALIDHLAQGLQKWIGWEKDKEVCCLKGENGIGKKCTCSTGGGSNCCTGDSCTCNTPSDKKCCYKSAYSKTEALWTTIVNGKPGSTVNTEKSAQEVHLLARIFLGSVCLIWSGLSQLGFLTGKSGERWTSDTVGGLDNGLGSFMAAMGYDLDRLNGRGDFVCKLLKGEIHNGKDGIQWKEFKNGADNNSVAEYYSTIYGNAKTAVGMMTEGKRTEQVCEQYPLLVLHILASGYFRAGSAGAKGITSAAKEAQKKDTDTDEASKKPRNPRTIREILYWLSALPYSQGYKDLVKRMQEKIDQMKVDKEYTLQLYNEGKKMTYLKKDCITHYLLAACGYCPLVLIGIQGTINTSGKDSDSTTSSPADENKRCDKHKKDPRSGRCIYKEDTKTAVSAAPPAPGDGELKKGQVCYGGYHLDVKQFGPLHGMYANGLYGFDMGGSAAQCLDQLRVYVYHCFYQLYFLRKQCKEGVTADNKAVLGWQSCRYGKGVSGNTTTKWQCTADAQGGNTNHTKNCGFRNEVGSNDSPLMSFLCDALWALVCGETKGKGVDDYPPIETHWNTENDNPKGHFGTKELDYPKLCPVPMGWQAETSSTGGTQRRENHFKDLTKGTHKTEELQKPATGSASAGTYPAHCTGNTLSHLLEYYCDPDKCHGTLVVLLRLLACITPTVPRTLGDLFGFYYYVVNSVGFKSWDVSRNPFQEAFQTIVEDDSLGMLYRDDSNGIVNALERWSTGECTNKKDTLKCLVECPNDTCGLYLSPLTGEKYRYLPPSMAGTYLSWLVYLIGEFQKGLEGLRDDYKDIQCKLDGCSSGKAGAAGTGCGGQSCAKGSHGNTCNTGGSSQGVCQCASVVSCTGVLPVLYKYGFGYGDVKALHNTKGQKKCHDFLDTLKRVQESGEFQKLTTSINQLIYTTRLPWIFVLTIAWLVAVLYLAFGAIWPLDWTHMRSHCRGWFRKSSLSPWEILMVGKKKGRGILEFFGGN